MRKRRSASLQVPEADSQGCLFACALQAQDDDPGRGSLFKGSVGLVFQVAHEDAVQTIWCYCAQGPQRTEARMCALAKYFERPSH